MHGPTRLKETKMQKDATLSMPDNYRQERIERLLQELRYEVTRGMMEGDLRMAR